MSFVLYTDEEMVEDYERYKAPVFKKIKEKENNMKANEQIVADVIEFLNTNLRKANNRIKELENDITSLKNDNNRLKKELDDNRPTDFDYINSQYIKDLRDDREAYKGALNEVQLENDDLIKENSELKNRIDTLTYQINMVFASENELKAACEYYRKKSAKANKHNQELEHENAELKKNATIKSIKYWKDRATQAEKDFAVEKEHHEKDNRALDWYKEQYKRLKTYETIVNSRYGLTSEDANREYYKKKSDE